MTGPGSRQALPADNECDIPVEPLLGLTWLVQRVGHKERELICQWAKLQRKIEEMVRDNIDAQNHELNAHDDANYRAGRHATMQPFREAPPPGLAVPFAAPGFPLRQAVVPPGFTPREDISGTSDQALPVRWKAVDDGTSARTQWSAPAQSILQHFWPGM